MPAELTEAARLASDRAGARARVQVRALEQMDGLREVSELFAQVWGRNEQGVPMPREMLRSLAHAGGLVCAAYDEDSGELLGAAALGRAVGSAAYSYIAGVRPGLADRGIGFALKQFQRAWGLEHGIDRVSWTFDPLVARNARFNLGKLGVVVHRYEPAFYGRMTDQINGDDPADRLVAQWALDSPAAIAAAAGRLPSPPSPPIGYAAQPGPDGAPAHVSRAGQRWVRVPEDIVALRRRDPEQAGRWRTAVRGWFVEAFAAGLVADGVDAHGWYHLAPPPPADTPRTTGPSTPASQESP